LVSPVLSTTIVWERGVWHRTFWLRRLEAVLAQVEGW
jgi:hypothetical protein